MLTPAPRSYSLPNFVLVYLLMGVEAVNGETAFVKYRGEVDLSHFSCQDITRSSMVRRVCYDAANEYMLISLNGTFYHYCEIDAATVEGLHSAASMGRYFNTTIKGRFDCRVNRVPSYQSME